MLRICFLAALLAMTSVSYAEVPCTYNNISFSTGAVSCQSDHEYKCSNGEWVSLNKPCTSLIKPSKTTKPKPKGNSVKIDEKTKKTKIGSLACLSFTPADKGKVIIRNSCAKCQVATVVWDQKTEFSKYKVEPNSTLKIAAEGKVGNLIAEEPCP